MTRKRTAPGKFTPEDERLLERLAYADLGRLHTAQWPGMMGLWCRFAHLSPATRQRIALYAIRSAAIRHEPIPIELIVQLEQAFEVQRARSSSTLGKQGLKAARIIADGGSDRAAGSGVGVSHQTIAKWRQRDEFKCQVGDFKTLSLLDFRLQEIARAGTENLAAQNSNDQTVNDAIDKVPLKHDRAGRTK